MKALLRNHECTSVARTYKTKTPAYMDRRVYIFIVIYRSVIAQSSELIHHVKSLTCTDNNA